VKDSATSADVTLLRLKKRLKKRLKLSVLTVAQQ